MIAREQIEQMFQRARAEFRWNIDDACIWGFFFRHQDRDRLVRLGRELEGRGFHFVGIMEPDIKDDDQDLLMMHVEREERHTVDTLHALNRLLDELAHQYGAIYDGMDVGPLDG